MATTSTMHFGEQNKNLFHAPVLEIGALLTDSYFQETPRTIHKDVQDYVGIDIFPGNGVDRVLNLCHTNEIPTEWKNYFNTIHCHCVLEHVTDIFTMARNIDSITKTDGVLYLGSVCMENSPDPTRSLEVYTAIHRLPIPEF